MTENYYDVIIVGGGPAGLSAAIYMARAKYKCLVLEKKHFGGQITITSEVVNYPGIFHTSGEKLTKEMQKQAESFGAEFLLADVNKIEKSGEMYTIYTDKGEMTTIGVIIASGASPRVVGFEGEEEFKGRGVAYCATCDGEFFTGKDIYVVGSGFAACEEGLFLTRFANKVIMVIREEDFTCTGNVVEEVKKHEKVEIHYNTTVSKVEGQNFVQSITLQKGEELEKYEDPKGIGVFVFVGYAPASEVFADLVTLNHQKYIVTDEDQKTNQDGIYAAGDICIKNLRQVVTAVSDGAKAATSLEKYIADLYEKLHLQKREYVKPKMSHNESMDSTKPDIEDGNFISATIIEELQPVFSKFESKLLLKYKLDGSDISKEVQGFMQEFNKITDMVTCVMDDTMEAEALPVISIYNEQGHYKGVSFHGVPGGHEFNSFILGLYNAAGPGQKILDTDVKRIQDIKKDTKIQIAVTLSCTNCPELVMAVERLPFFNEKVTVDIYDLSQFESLKEKYNIMSVPCMIINEEQIHFGKKNLSQVLDILEV